jgi:very-short-patch-repair endonuclease
MNPGNFTRNLDELLYLAGQKSNLVHNLKKNYRENVHYIETKTQTVNHIKRNGGQNKVTIMLTEEAFEIFKNSYNMRNRYIVDVSKDVKCVKFGMCIENQTIGFIANAYSNVLDVKRQHIMGKYRVDLYFVDHKLVVECDENGHEDRDTLQEQIRENYLNDAGNKLIRFNPNARDFDLSDVMRKINAVLFAPRPV